MAHSVRGQAVSPPHKKTSCCAEDFLGQHTDCKEAEAPVHAVQAPISDPAWTSKSPRGSNRVSESALGSFIHVVQMLPVSVSCSHAWLLWLKITPKRIAKAGAATSISFVLRDFWPSGEFCHHQEICKEVAKQFLLKLSLIGLSSGPSFLMTQIVWSLHRYLSMEDPIHNKLPAGISLRNTLPSTILPNSFTTSRVKLPPWSLPHFYLLTSDTPVILIVIFLIGLLLLCLQCLVYQATECELQEKHRRHCTTKLCNLPFWLHPQKLTKCFKKLNDEPLKW